MRRGNPGTAQSAPPAAATVPGSPGRKAAWAGGGLLLPDRALGSYIANRRRGGDHQAEYRGLLYMSFHGISKM